MRAAMQLRPDDAWAALLARDARYDGTFVYAVSSTGIYCRPICPSRRPARRNVAFYDSAADAVRAGYRACRRCRPDQDQPSATHETVSRARAYLDDHLDERVTLQRLAGAVGASPHHLQRTFKRLVGVSPREYVQLRRTERLKHELRRGRTVSRATYEAGFGSGSRVYEQARTHLGMTPGAYKRGGAAERIRFTIVDCPLGRLLVAATAKGVTAVALGDTDQELETYLRREYPRADIAPSDAALTEWVAAIVRYLDGSDPDMAVPLDVRGTVFQYRVWKALQQIPYGATRTYGEIAESIGAPTAARAVARACATNPAALVIPCHRAVRRDGRTGGYRWGEDRKRNLLEMESGAGTGTGTVGR